MKPLTQYSANCSPAPWRVSLHGGHSGTYCDHAVDSLEEIVQAAITSGYHTFGVSEHAPRVHSKHLYNEEIAMGWNVETLARMFQDYAAEMDMLIPKYADRITLLKGFEAEVVPTQDYGELMLSLRKEFNFEYFVGSVHWFGDIIFDYTKESFARAVRDAGNIEKLCLAYYDKVVEMVGLLNPEVIGHLDLPRKYVERDEDIETPTICAAAERALNAIAEQGGILDLNTAGIRKGLGHPYPGPWILDAARERGIPFCFGDDSHSVLDVGADIDEAREYLLAHDISSITVLTRDERGAIIRKAEPLT